MKSNKSVLQLKGFSLSKEDASLDVLKLAIQWQVEWIHFKANSYVHFISGAHSLDVFQLLNHLIFSGISDLLLLSFEPFVYF